jgi:hypothetical protein
MNQANNGHVLGAQAGKTKVNWSRSDVIMALFQAVYISKLHTPARGNEGDRWEVLATQMSADRIFANCKEFKGPALKKAFLNIIKDIYSEKQNLSGKVEDQIASRDLVRKVGLERELFLSERQAAVEKSEHDKAVKEDSMLGFERELVVGHSNISSSSGFSSPSGNGTRPPDPNGPNKYELLLYCLVYLCAN